MGLVSTCLLLDLPHENLIGVLNSSARISAESSSESVGA